MNRIRRRFVKRCAAASMSMLLVSGMFIAPNVLNVYAENDSGIEFRQASNGLRNVMYYGDWSIWGGQGMFYPAGIPADQLTHLNFAFVDFDADGTLKFTDKDAAVGAPVGMPDVTWGAANGGIFSALQDLRAKNPNLRLGVSMGGWSKSGDFSAIAANPTARANFVRNVMKFLRYTDMDFLDLDWEYPNSARIGDSVDNTQDEGTPNAGSQDRQNYITLLQDLRAALDEQGEELGRYYELSVALPAAKSTLALGVDVQQLFDVVDFANIMTYDLHGAWDSVSSHQTGLYTNPDDPNADLGLSVDDSVQYLLSEGAPSEKIVIGAAFYTRGWENVDVGEVAGMPGLFGEAEAINKDADQSLSFGAKNEAPLTAGSGGRNGGIWSYGSLDLLHAAYPGLVEYWDDVAKAPYLYNEDGAFFTYDNVRSVQEKANYVLANNLGGMISWMQSNDAETNTPGVRDELTKAIKNGLFGAADLTEYTITGPQLDVAVDVTTYSDSQGNGYEFTLSNNERPNESGEVLTGVETAFETVKSPKLYIETESGVNFVPGSYYDSGTVTNQNGYAVVDFTSSYNNRLFEQGETIVFKLKVDGNVSPEDIVGIELSQRIYPTGAEIGRQTLDFDVAGVGSEDPDPTDPTDETNPVEPTAPTDPTDETNPVEPTDPTDETDPVEPTDPTDETDPDDGDDEIAAYDPEKEYTAGDTVTYNGNTYRAKWWTKGDVPGNQEWGPWELID